MTDGTSDKQGHADPRVPERDICVLRYALAKWADEKPDQVYAVFEDGSSWTYRETRDLAVAKAAGLAALGVKQGDHVAMALPNGKESLLSFFAINYLGAVYVPFNTAYKGRILEHVVANSDASIILIHGQIAGRLSEIELARLETAVVVGEGDPPDALRRIGFDDIQGSADDLPDLERPIEPWDTQSIIYTSGTTGPSKGVLSSYLHMYTNPGPESWPFVLPDDRFLINMPMFHIGGMGLCFAMLARGGSIAMMENFATQTFWQFVARSECTVIFLLGAMATFLLKEPPSDADTAHKVRLAFLVPLTSNHRDVSERFGVDIYTIFNMTEVSTPIVSDPNPEKPGTCGKARDGVEVRLVDDNDCEVAVGEIGEMIVRTDRPWAMNHGYYKNLEATVEAWRNGWFHTGDAFRQDEDGYFYFVDRVKDAIRRRGENISSFEVEAEVIAHPDIREAAAVGVPSEFSEDEVLVALAPMPDREIDPAALLHFLSERMPYFMLPRYIRIMDDLPKTPTEKVRKHVLRAEGVSPDTWDREAAGIRIRREKI
jgi:crotonobetaine/carnitine-CoA ligase